MDTRERILMEAVKLFARDGFDAVTVEMIAEAVGIKAPSLYKHFKSKRDIFESILREMERRDAENAMESEMPAEEKTRGDAYDEYGHVDLQAFLDYCRKMFRYWTEDEFAAAFRKMLTVEQYKNEEMNELYHQYLGAGPLGYTADIVGSEEAALALYGPMFLMYSISDSTGGKYGGSKYDDRSKNVNDSGQAYKMLDEHLNRWYSEYGKQI